MRNYILHSKYSAEFYVVFRDVDGIKFWHDFGH